MMGSNMLCDTTMHASSHLADNTWIALYFAQQRSVQRCVAVCRLHHYVMCQWWQQCG